MSTLPILSRHQPIRQDLGFALALAGSLFWICGTAAAGAAGGDAPADRAAIPVVPVIASPVSRADSKDEIERQRRLRELRRHLLEHSQSWRGDAALRRSAAMPEPTDTPAVVADKILPLAPQAGAEGVLSAGAVSVQVLPLPANGAAGRLQALPNAAPGSLAAPVAPALPRATMAQDAAAIQASAIPLESGSIVDAVNQSDSRLTERERRQLRQQLRQVLRLQEPVGNR